VRRSPGTVGFGADPGPDDERWQAARSELTPEKSLARITANARATVATTALVGTLLTGLGLVSGQTMLGGGLARWAALGAAAVALTSVLTGLVYLAQRLREVNPRDLGAVRQWYEQQFRRARLAVAASWLLVLAVLLAAVAVGATLVPGGGSGEPALGLRVAGSGAARAVDADVTVSGLPAAAVVRVLVLGVGGSCPEAVLVTARGRADRSGKVTLTGHVAPAPACHRAFRLEVSGDAVRTAGLTVP
jgi:hypothetical protein